MRVGSRPDSRCGRKKRAYSMVRTAWRGKSGLHRVGWRLITARREARNRATETSLVESRTSGKDEGETRQPPPGATPNRQATTRLAELAGRWLEPWSNPGPRGMAVGAARSLQNPAYRPASHFSPEKGSGPCVVGLQRLSIPSIGGTAPRPNLKCYFRFSFYSPVFKG